MTVERARQIVATMRVRYERADKRFQSAQRRYVSAVDEYDRVVERERQRALSAARPMRALKAKAMSHAGMTITTRQ